MWPAARRRTVLFLLPVLFLWPAAEAQVYQAKTILLIEDQQSAPAVESFARVFEEKLISESSEQLEFYRESLDTVLIPTGDYQSEVRNWYEHKYSKRKLDLVVAIGPKSHDFVRTEHDRLFHGVPILFSVDIKDDRETAKPDPNSTGVWMDFDPVATLDAARQLLPGTKHVVVVAGNGLFDQLLTGSVRTKLQGYQAVDFTYVTNLDIAPLLIRVHSLPADTIILLLSVSKDSKQRYFFLTYAMPLICSAANVPVFGMADLMVEHGGIVGGHVASFSAAAPEAANIALRLLRGASPSHIPSVVLANQYVFDWRQMRRWGLDPLRLPQGSTLLNRQPNLWQEYRRAILAVLAVLLLQAGLLVYLLFERRRRRLAQRALERDIVERKKAEAALVDLSRRLISTREEEQCRVARELHDDFNQRLAILAIKLKTTSELVADHPIASEQMDELCEETGDIAADLQKLSHNLHSSVLYNLGLEDGLSNLCSEFTEQHGVEVRFTSQVVPQDLSHETSLCLFRIAQEGLNNVKKHSGATTAYVELHGNEEEIELSIIDKGLGFDDRNGSFKAGLGLRSMQERVRTVGGTIEIQSRHGIGTTISARIPTHDHEMLA